MSDINAAMSDARATRHVSVRVSDTGREITGEVDGFTSVPLSEDMVPAWLDVTPHDGAAIIEHLTERAENERTWAAPGDTITTSSRDAEEGRDWSAQHTIGIHDNTISGASINDDTTHTEVDLDAQARARIASTEVETIANDADTTPTHDDDTAVAVAREAATSARLTNATTRGRFGAAVNALRAQTLTQVSRDVTHRALAATDTTTDTERRLDRSDYPTPEQREQGPALGRW